MKTTISIVYKFARENLMCMASLNIILIPSASLLEVIVIFQVYINIINIIVFAMLDTNTDARYEYAYINGYEYKYKYELIETKKGKE